MFELLRDTGAGSSFLLLTLIVTGVVWYVRAIRAQRRDDDTEE